jgi:hypothetical protein
VWTAAQGHSGGTLLGIQTGDITVVEKGMGTFFTNTFLETNLFRITGEISKHRLGKSAKAGELIPIAK